jgi:MFS family permease
MAGEAVETKSEAAPPDPSDAAPASGAGHGGLAVLRVLHHREFALFWSAQTLSLVGTWMQNFAQSWAVASLTSDPMALGLVSFVSALPMLILMPLGGVAADRMERRRILIYTQWLMLAVSAAMGVLVAMGKLELWHIYVMALPLGVATAYELPAYQAFIPQLVDRRDLPLAISLNQATFHGSRIIGPMLASWFVNAWGMAAAFFANAFSFAPVIGALLMIRARPAASQATGSTRTFMAEGLRYVRERPGVMALLGLTALTSFFIFPNFAILTPHYVKEVLHMDAGALGAIMSFSGAGALLGSAAMLAVPEGERTLRIAVCSLALLVTMTTLAWASELWLVVAAAAIQSFAISHSLGLASLIIQNLVPDELRGRVMSLYTLTFTGIMPFSALAIPWLVKRIGMRWELQASGILYALGGMAVVARLRTARDMRDEGADLGPDSS